MLPTKSPVWHGLSLLLLLYAGALCRPAAASSITLFSTGVDASGTPLPGGASDPHWTIIAGPGITNPTPAVVLNNQRVGNYAQSKDSAWVWVNAGGTDVLNSPYTFQLSFDLTGVNREPRRSPAPGASITTARFSSTVPLRWSGALTLDGGDNHGNYQSFHTFQITGGFVSGINTLDSSRPTSALSAAST